MKHGEDPHALARELLGREFDELEPDEQRVLTRVAAGTFAGRDADELAQANATWGDRLADRVAAVGGSWGFIGAFGAVLLRSEEHTSELQSLMRISYAVFCLKKKKNNRIQKSKV